MYKCSCLALALVLSMGNVDTHAGPVLFQFLDRSAQPTPELDGEPAGATMTRDDGNPANAITLTSLAVMGPLYEESFPGAGDYVWNGAYVPSITNIPGGNALGINNQGPVPNNNSELQSFNPAEYWELSFDRAVVFQEIDFSSLGGATAIVTIGSNSWNFTASGIGAGEIASDPFNGLYIPASTPIRITGGGDPEDFVSDFSWRLTSFTVVEAAPLELEIDRLTGNVLLRNVSPTTLSLFGYQIDSVLGALDPEQWKTIASNYDAGSPEELDPDDDWTTLSSTSGDYATDLSEVAFGGDGQAGNGLTLASGQAIDLGNSWIPTPYENDISGLHDIGGTPIPLSVKYVGNGGEPLAVGDLNHDGAVDTADWVIFNSNDPSESLAFTSIARAYSMGDLDGDLDIDTLDYRLFEAAYDLANGEGAFFAMLDGQVVPEPSTLLLAMLGLPLARALRRRRATICYCVLATLVACFSGGSLHAQSVIFNFPNNSELDGNAPVGSTVVRSPDGGAVNRITLTTTDARAPLYADAALTWDGTSYLTTGTQTHSGAGLFIENPGTHTPPDDTSGFNQHESLSIEFNRPVRILEFDFSSITDEAGDQGEVSVEGLVSPILFTFNTLSGGTANLMPNPFGSLAIPSGTDITFTGLGSYQEGGSSSWRLVGITVEEILPEMTARVNSLTGEVLLTNTGEFPFAFDSYELRSGDAALRIGDGGWTSLSDQGVDTIGPGIGQSWDEGSNVTSSIVVERFLRGETVLAPGEFVSLGNLFDLGVGSIDNLSLYFSDKQTHALEGFVELFTPSQGLPGDFNNDGTVDAADYTVWRNNLGAADDSALNGNGDGLPGIDASDYNLWKTYFGTSVGVTSLLVSQTVPEPTTIATVGLALAGIVILRRRIVRRSTSAGFVTTLG